MIIWAICTIVIGFSISTMIVGVTLDAIKSYYPKHHYIELGEKINEGKSYIEIKRRSYDAMVPKFSKIRFLFTQEGCMAIVFGTGLGLMAYFMVAWLAEWLSGVILDERVRVLTEYRNWTAGIFYVFISILTPFALIQAHFDGIKNEIKNNGLNSATNKPVRFGFYDDDKPSPIQW